MTVQTRLRKQKVFFVLSTFLLAIASTAFVSVRSEQSAALLTANIITADGGPIIIDNSDTGFRNNVKGQFEYLHESDNTNISGAYNGDIHWEHRRNIFRLRFEEIAAWTFSGLDSTKYYEIWVTWLPFSTASTHAPYSVKHANGTSNLFIDQTVAPSDLNTNGYNWLALGAYLPTRDGDLIVELSNDTDYGDIVIADAARIEIAASQNSQDLVILDDGDAGFSAIKGKFIQTINNDAYGSDVSWQSKTGLLNPEATAIWRLNNLRPDSVYNISVTWPTNDEASTEVIYSIADTNGLHSVLKDQTQTGGADNWKELGQFTSDSHGRILVSLSNNINNGIIMADAVKAQFLSAAGSASSQSSLARTPDCPNISFAGHTEITDLQQRIDFFTYPRSRRGNFGEYVIDDFNDDGTPDRADASVTLDNGSAILVTLHGVPLNERETLYDIQGESTQIDAADLNEDGILDIVTNTAGATSVSVLLGFGDGTFAEPIEIETGEETDGLVVRDVTEDNKPEIIVSGKTDPITAYFWYFENTTDCSAVDSSSSSSFSSSSSEQMSSSGQSSSAAACDQKANILASLDDNQNGVLDYVPNDIDEIVAAYLTKLENWENGSVLPPDVNCDGNQNNGDIDIIKAQSPFGLILTILDTNTNGQIDITEIGTYAALIIGWQGNPSTAPDVNFDNASDASDIPIIKWIVQNLPTA